ncbi:MAG: hypothetical protein D6770_07245 [Anaerolineae bacterium]|nr:MAG: hypothetical protein D6770_07245 [Anaerolineae bacterium]
MATNVYGTFLTQYLSRSSIVGAVQLDDAAEGQKGAYCEATVTAGVGAAGVGKAPAGGERGVGVMIMMVGWTGGGVATAPQAVSKSAPNAIKT